MITDYPKQNFLSCSNMQALTEVQFVAGSTDKVEVWDGVSQRIGVILCASRSGERTDVMLYSANSSSSASPVDVVCNIITNIPANTWTAVDSSLTEHFSWSLVDSLGIDVTDSYEFRVLGGALEVRSIVPVTETLTYKIIGKL